MGPNLIFGLALGAAVVTFVLVVVVREWLLERDLDRTTAGTEERYAALVERREALKPPSRPAPVVLEATEVVAELPWDREPIDLDTLEGRRSA